MLACCLATPALLPADGLPYGAVGWQSGQAGRLPSGLVERGQPNWWEGIWEGRQEAGACCWVEVVWLEGRWASMICYITYCRGYYIGYGIV